MTDLGIDPDEVQVCYVESFNYESDELADNYSQNNNKIYSLFFFFKSWQLMVY